MRNKLNLSDLEITKISHHETTNFVLHYHYAHRKPTSIIWSYGVWNGAKLVGICIIGRPASYTLSKGVCGADLQNKVYELSRLYLIDGLPKNTASKLISHVLRDLKSEDLIIISYADSLMNHRGYIYQATNWLYTGATAERTDMYTPNGKHHRHANKEDYKHLRKVRSSKHRYIYFTGKSKKSYRDKLMYDIKPYPKGDNIPYKVGDVLPRKILNKDTGKSYIE